MECTAAQTAYMKRKVHVAFTEDGEIRNISLANAVRCLQNLYERNCDPSSPDFAVLTHVQERALHTILTERCGVRVRRGIEWPEVEDLN